MCGVGFCAPMAIIIYKDYTYLFGGMLKYIREKNDKANSLYESIIKQWGPPVLGAMIGSIGGVGLSSYNSNISKNRFFLEKRVIVADNIATEFSKYILNYKKLINYHNNFDERKSKKNYPTNEEREAFFKTITNRDNSKLALFSYLDTARLYYSDKTSDLIASYQAWDDGQSTRTVENLPDINEWRTWQNKILRCLHEEISKDD